MEMNTNERNKEKRMRGSFTIKLGSFPLVFWKFGNGGSWVRGSFFVLINYK